MAFFNKENVDKSEVMDPELERVLSVMRNQHSEAYYYRNLVDTRTKVVVVLKTGERLRGRIRYYDNDLLSLGRGKLGPNTIIPKQSVRYLCEEQDSD